MTTYFSLVILLVRLSKIEFTAEVYNPYAFNFVPNNLYERQSKAFKRSVSKT